MTPSTTRLLANTTSKFSSLSIHANRLPIRAFSQTSFRKQDGEYDPLVKPSSLLSKLSTSPPSWQTRPPTGQAPRDRARADSNGGNGEVQHLLAKNVMSWARNEPTRSALDSQTTEANEDWGPPGEPFHFHIYSHRHNTHITVTKPNKDAILSMSTGNIGFKKGKRGSYDAAYQLCAYVLDKLNQGAWHRKITTLEVVLRGFGQGREACTKVLLGNEGRLLRPLIRKVSDATRLKFGGTRSKKPRRLG
jgi:small subunit ribosomal protein S11